MKFSIQPLKCHAYVQLAQNFQLSPYVLFFFAEKSPSEPSRSISVTPIVFLATAGLPAPRCLATAPTRHGRMPDSTATQGITPLSVSCS